MHIDLLYQEQFQVRFYESEATGRATAAAFCRYAQEAADGHCRQFGMSLLQVREQNRMWVITRFRLQIDRYPMVGERISVETWASSRTNGIRAVREFRFIDESGKQLGNAKSIWLLLDAGKKRPVRLPEAVLSICNFERSDPEEFELPRLQGPGRIDVAKTFAVGWREMDANNHVNNVTYVEWLLETLPLETRRDKKLEQLDVEFLGEACFDDQVTAESEIDAESSVHRLKSAAGTLLSLAVVRHV